MRIFILISLFLSLSMVGYSSEPEISSSDIVDLTKPAENGDAEAQYRLGLYYFTGDGVEKDRKKAVFWITKAAEQGHAKAQVSLAFCYEDGMGVEKDMEKAVFWWTKLAERGKAEAQQQLGRCYFTGEGVEKDMEKAAFWFTKAAEQGKTEAQAMLGILYSSGLGVLQDYVLAHKWYNIALSLGDETARELREELEARMTPDQIAEAQKQAREWLANLAEQGHTMAQMLLGICYATGEGGEMDLKKAAFWFTKAAEQGKFEAQLVLGHYYAEGEGVPQDYVLAHKWYNIASSLGSEDARELRKELEAHMTPDQIAEAQKLAREWLANWNNPVEGAGKESNIAQVYKTDNSDDPGNSDQVYELQETDEKPRPTRQFEPIYPAELKRRKIGGRVDIEFVVDEQGNVIDPIATRSVHPDFERPALDAIRRWKFTPGKVNGKPVKVRVRAPLVFTPR